MKKVIRCLLIAAVSIVLLGKFTLFAETTSTIPDTPAGKRVKESLEIINSGDMAQIQDYISTQFTRSFIKKFGKERTFNVYYGFFEKYKGLEFHKVRESSAQRFVGVFRCRQTGSAYLFGLAVRSRSPHKIQGMTIFPMTHPDQPESLESLTEKEKVEMLKSYLDIFGESKVFSGAVLLAKNGRVIFNKAHGLADRQEGVLNQIETRFNLASLNKMFTAVAVAQLCEQGKMSYNDPVGKHLDSDWISPKISKKVQVKHLLSHTSGIGISKKDDNLKYLEESIGKKFRRIDDYKILTDGAFLKTDPGKESSYSNIGFHLLGPIIEKVSGEGYYDYIQVHIFDVAGMKDAGFDELDQLDSNTARGYVKEQKDGKISWRSNESNCSWKGTPAGCAYSTVGDLLKFEQALKKNLLVSKETRDLLFTPKTELGARSYGYGFSVRQFDELLKVGHTGGYIGINNHFSMYLNNGYTVIILCNIDLISGSSVSDIEFFISGLFF
ncbi:MAG: beta-lactamase family protein [Candidatus Aminicenantes bacterium]|nr:beta-lactamase family protein [Candidatus Aminicenantes bacterium]